MTLAASHSRTGAHRPAFGTPNFNLVSGALAVLFLVAAGVVAAVFTGSHSMTLFVIAASVAGGYMALNIGANDVANNVGAAVGSGALTLWGAIAIAVVFESAGALIAGGDVVSTISKGIIDASLVTDTRVFLLAMGAALLAAAVWLHVATWVGAPVSTTHAIVGGVLGSIVAAAGLSAVNWDVMSKIAASWFISPLLGGAIAAIFLAVIERTIFLRRDMIAASRRWVPIFVAAMTAIFSLYLVMKGLKHIWRPDLWVMISLTLAVFALASVALRPVVARASDCLENRRRSVNGLFTIPLICAAALLSFAHGANDVANAVGPLSAIVSVAHTPGITAKVDIPFWVMLIGATGISIGLALFGAKLIRTVGRQLTKLDQTRAFCICLSAAITVIGASALGLPVSSTHTAIGAVFGIGFYREFRCNSRTGSRIRILDHLKSISRRVLTSEPVIPRPPVKCRPRRLVRRRQLLTIVAAWFITVPCAALMSAAMLHAGLLLFGN